MNLKMVLGTVLAIAVMFNATNLAVAADTDTKTDDDASKINQQKFSTIILDEDDYKNKKYEAKKLLFMTSSDGNGKLLFSDSPEIVETDGILYQDTIQGDGRLLYYHLNGTKDDKKIAVIAENLSDKDNEIKISRKAISGPSDDFLYLGEYAYVGKTALIRYFDKQEPETVVIPAKGKTLLYAPEDERIVPADRLVCGMFDFNAQEDVKLSVVMAPSTANLLEYVDEAPVLKADKHRLRGTYEGKDRYLTNVNPYIPEQMGSAYFYIGDNKTDLYKYGYDKTDSSITHNYGNYGVVYTFHPQVKGNGRTSYYLEPLGGIYAGAVSVRIGENGERTTIETPIRLIFYGRARNKSYYSYLGTYNNADDIYFEYTSPGASNLPVKIILIPED